tara:strand:- start:953 stop:1213 length:261 start_codon:yes stop_codon:yes gene_type:complete
MKEINHKIEENENVEVKGITLLKRDDGNYAVPGGGYVTNVGYAEKIAKRLANNFPKVKSPMGKLAAKTVSRLTAKNRDGGHVVLGV